MLSWGGAVWIAGAVVMPTAARMAALAQNTAGMEKALARAPAPMHIDP